MTKAYFTNFVVVGKGMLDSEVAIQAYDTDGKVMHGILDKSNFGCNPADPRFGGLEVTLWSVNGEAAQIILPAIGFIGKGDTLCVYADDLVIKRPYKPRSSIVDTSGWE